MEHLRIALIAIEGFTPQEGNVDVVLVDNFNTKKKL